MDDKQRKLDGKPAWVMRVGRGDDVVIRVAVEPLTIDTVLEGVAFALTSEAFYVFNVHRHQWEIVPTLGLHAEALRSAVGRLEGFIERETEVSAILTDKSRSFEEQIGLISAVFEVEVEMTKEHA